MKYNVKESTPAKHVVEIELSAEEFDVFYNNALKEIAEAMEIPGFRKGKAPMDIVEQQATSEHILSQAMDAAINKNWLEYLDKSLIEAISQPEISIMKIAKGNPFIFNVSVEVLPAIDLPDVKKIAGEIKKTEINISDQEIEDALLWLRNARATLTPKDGPAEKGNFVEFSFQIENLPDTFSHLKGEQKDAFILGKNHFIEGMEDAILGMKTGEEKEFEGKIDQHLDKMQPEKMPVKVKVKINSVQLMNLPELTDEWVKTLGRFDSVSALKEDIKKGLTEEKRTAELNQQRIKAMDKILEKTKIEIPAILLKREQDNLFEELKDRINYELKISLDEYLKKVNKTEEQIRKDFESLAQDRIKRFLILHQIGKNEKIKATEEEVAKRVEEIIKQYPAEQKAQIDIQRLTFLIGDDITKEKIFAFLGLN